MSSSPLSYERLRAMYPGGRANPAARRLARFWAVAFKLGVHTPRLSPRTALGDLVVAAVHAVVVAYEASPPLVLLVVVNGYALIGDPVRAGRLRPVDAYLATRPSSAH
jgi:hypothetical protein